MAEWGLERCQVTVAKPSEALQVCAGASQSFGGENLRRGAGPVVAQRTHTRWLGRQGWEVSAKLRMSPPFSPLAPILAARRSRGAGWRPRCLRKTEGAFSPELAKWLHLVLTGGANTAPALAPWPRGRRTQAGPLNSSGSRNVPLRRAW